MYLSMVRNPNYWDFDPMGHAHLSAVIVLEHAIAAPLPSTLHIIAGCV